MTLRIRKSRPTFFKRHSRGSFRIRKKIVPQPFPRGHSTENYFRYDMLRICNPPFYAPGPMKTFEGFGMLRLFSVLLFGLLLAANAVRAQNVFDRAIQIFKPEKKFAGVSLSTSITDLKKIGFICEEGTEAINKKLVEIVACDDEKYTSEIFGLKVKKREIYFFDGKLAVIKVFQRDASVTASSYNNLRNKIDSVFSRIKKPDTGNDAEYDFWDFGGGATLLSGPPTKHIIGIDNNGQLKIFFGLGLALRTSAFESITKN